MYLHRIPLIKDVSVYGEAKPTFKNVNFVNCQLQVKMFSFAKEQIRILCI